MFDDDAESPARRQTLAMPTDQPQGRSVAVVDQEIAAAENKLEQTDRQAPEYPDVVLQLASALLEKARASDATQPLATGARQQAAQLLEELVSDERFATYQRRDEALHLYGANLAKLGRAEDMRRVYYDLIKSYPSSPYVANAYFTFAEHYFLRGEIDTAGKFYTKVALFKDSPVYARALYKLGWCHLNGLGGAGPDYVRALGSFTDTIMAVDKGRAGTQEQALQLRRAAMQGMIQAYVPVGKPSKAAEFFERLAPEDLGAVLRALADAYAEAGMTSERHVICQQIAKRGLGPACD
jgi:tetratricopeptide (TPR) repeat protein